MSEAIGFSIPPSSTARGILRKIRTGVNALSALGTSDMPRPDDTDDIQKKRKISDSKADRFGTRVGTRKSADADESQSYARPRVFFYYSSALTIYVGSFLRHGPIICN